MAHVTSTKRKAPWQRETTRRARTRRRLRPLRRRKRNRRRKRPPRRRSEWRNGTGYKPDAPARDFDKTLVARRASRAPDLSNQAFQQIFGFSHFRLHGKRRVRPRRECPPTISDCNCSEPIAPRSGRTPSRPVPRAPGIDSLRVRCGELDVTHIRKQTVIAFGRIRPGKIVAGIERHAQARHALAESTANRGLRSASRCTSPPRAERLPSRPDRSSASGA